VRLAHCGAQPRVPSPLLGVLDVRQRSLVTQLHNGSVRSVAKHLETQQKAVLELLGEVAPDSLEPARRARLDRLLEDKGLRALSKSEVGRRAKAADQQLLGELSERSLAGVSLAAVMVDGTPVGDRTIVWALGITMDGTKVPLAIEESPTETSVAVKAMLKNMRGRGLDMTDVLWVIDGGRALRGAIRSFTNDHAEIQRCVVHKSRNVVMDNLRAVHRKEIGDDVRERLSKAWHEPNHTLAAERLKEVADWLRAEGHSKAAESVMEGVEMTLTLQRLGVEDPVIRRAVNQTNIIESAHMDVSRRKEMVKRWLDPDGTMRPRRVTAAVACAEESWGKVASEPALEHLSLAVLAGRHPEVTVDLENHSGVLTLSAVGVTDQRDVYGVLRDLRAWATRNGKAFDVAEAAIDAVPRPDRLRAWMDRESTGRVSREARARQRPADALAVAREGVPDMLAAPLAEAALHAAPDMVAMDDRALRSEAARVWVASDGLRAISPEADAWWAANKDVAAREIASHGGRQPRHPLAGGRAQVLGSDRAVELMGEASYQGALSADTNAPPPAHSVLEQLDGPVERLLSAGRAVAACRELDRREQLQRVVEQASEQDASADARSGVAPLDRYRTVLGRRRGTLLHRYAEALGPQLADLDAAALQHLSAEVGDPWREFDATRALRTVRGEERTRPDMVRRHGEALHEVARHERNGATQRAAHCHQAADAQLEALKNLSVELASDDSLDRFIAEHPEAAVDHALHVELERRRELEAPERAAAQAEVVVEPPVEIAM
jgi:transposase-like protein